MAVRTRTSIRTLVVGLAGLVISLAALDAAGAIGERHPFVSHEVTFTDASKGGMQIMPASCASSPSYFHNALPATGDGRGYVAYSGRADYGVYRNGVYLCVTNVSGITYFIPANTAAEMNAVKAKRSSLPGLTIY